MWISAALLLSLCSTAFAQTLEIAPTTVDKGSVNIFRMVLKPHTEKPIAALQWDLVYREGLRIEPSGVVPGMASDAAGKSLTCARKPIEEGNYRMTCILAGGIQTLDAGVIAIVRFETAKDTPAGEQTVDVERVVGVSAKLEPISIENTKAPITIR